MENAVNTNGRQEKFPSESQYFFKPEKEERRSFLILKGFLHIFFNIFLRLPKEHLKGLLHRKLTFDML